MAQLKTGKRATSKGHAAITQLVAGKPRSQLRPPPQNGEIKKELVSAKTLASLPSLVSRGDQMVDHSAKELSQMRASDQLCADHQTVGTIIGRSNVIMF